MNNDNNAVKSRENNKFSSVDKLNRLTAGRYHVLYPRYKEKTLKLLSHISRNENSYASILSKSDAVNNSTGADKDYWRSLTAAATLEIALAPNAVANLVCTQKARYNHPRLTGNIHQQCIAELHKAFIVNRVMLPGANGKRQTNYILRFALLVE